MLGHQFAHSLAPIRKVKEVQFGILSPEEIKAYSVAKIEHPEVIDESTHKLKVGGLNDTRMGTTDRNFKCQTCGEGMAECPGHFGHIELARPVFHPGFLVKVKKILECICVNCGKLKADTSDPAFADRIRLARDAKRRMAALLQFHVATYMDNDIAGIPQALQKSGRPVKAIRARLKGKEGRLRGNLMGKRVDFSARTVITGDPNLELDEVGVPKSIAMTLTYPERVTPYNIAYLQELVRNGPREYPGARYVIRDTGERIDLRHLKNGDYVLFNRQPSLHKMSMMCHRVRLMPYSTFRLNLSVTPPYNADFDGDEMNMHVPQSEETRAELSQIAWVPRQIISPQANKPVMDPKGGFLPGVLQVGIDDSSLELQEKLDEEYERLCEDRRLLRQFIYPGRDTTTAHYLPVNLNRIVQNATQIFHIDRRKPSDLDPAYIIDQVQRLAERLVVVRGVDTLTTEAAENASLAFRMHLRATFAARPVLEEYHLNKEAFDWVLGEVETKFNQSIVHPGEMCGTLAAQSIGEPATQMTLNTFHYAGVSSKNVTLGVPRLKEIINVAVNIKTPSLTVYLTPEIAAVDTRAKAVQTELAYTSLRTVTAAVEIWYDPDPSTTIIEEDKEFVDAFFAIPDEEIEQNLHLQSPWLLRLELDRSKMLDRKLTMNYVAGRIAESFKTDLFVIWSEDNAEKLIIRCRVLGGADKDEEEGDTVDEDIFLRQLEHTMLDSVSLRGVPGIQRVFLLAHDQIVVTDDGSIQKSEEKEWVLETDGVNLKTVMCIDGVDWRRTYSNSCVEIFNVLGIEAARAAIMKEMRNVIEFDGSYVNYRHLALLCDLMTHRGSLMAITRHGINRADTGALMRCSFEETVEILMEAAAVGEKDDCHGIAENIMFGQMAPMGTGAFDVALDMDMLKDVIVDHRLPLHDMLTVQADGGMTPAQVAMTPYDSNSPMWSTDMSFKGEQAAFSPLAGSGGEDTSAIRYLGYGQSPMGAGGMSPGPGYSPSSPNVYSPTSPYVPQSPYGGATSPYAGGTSPYATSPYYRGAATSPTYSPTSPALNLTSPSYSPTSPRYSPTSPSFSPTSPRYSPQSPSFSPTSPRYSPTSPSFSPASPRYSPTSPMQQSPASPKYSPTSPQSPASPKYSPTSPAYSPASPSYSPASPAYSPTSPQWSPSSPAQNSNPQNGTARHSAYSTSPSWD
ncbi:RPO21_1 [Sanghuangporus weigelae]